MKYRFFTIIVALFIIHGCSNTAEEQIQIDQGFTQYISGFTSGIISKTSRIHIKLTENSKQFTQPNEEVTDDVFDFVPSVDGEAYWLDARTIEFRPEEPFKSGGEYEVTFDLEKVSKVPKEFEVFVFKIRTITQSFHLETQGITPYEPKDLTWNRFTGRISTADFLEQEQVEQLLLISIGGQKLNATWVHNTSGRLHEFVVDSVERKEEVQIVLLEYSGKEFDIETNGKQEMEIPSLSDFKLMSTKLQQEPEQQVVLHFSDPLKANQQLRGLIRFADTDDLRFVVSNNIVTIYPQARLHGVHTLLIEESLQNTMARKLTKAEKIEMNFIETKPQVSFNHTGVILPSTQGLVFPFQAVNLNAVQVEIVKIYERNMHQFLQTNNLNGANQLTRVGKLVYKKKVNLLTDKILFGSWNTHYLDISKLIKTEPGALYRITLNIKQSYSNYPCEDSKGSEEEELEESLSDSWEDESYDSYEDDWEYYADDYDYYDDYDWKERENPCSASYYAYGKSITTNILASNLGVIAKLGKDKKMLVAVSDLRTAMPLKGVDVKLYDFQNQVIGQGSTGSDGNVFMESSAKPFLVIASKGKEKGYLKVQDGYALSTSHFNVRGAVVQDGLKGFLYGERGVWRPGDTLFLSFMLADEMNKIPADHPVKIELFNPKNQLKSKVVSTHSVNGLYRFTIPTSAEDMTGSWLAKVKVGNATFSKTVRIETVKPNRLKVMFDLGVDEIPSDMKSEKASLDVKWLHGAIAKNMKTNITVTLAPSTIKFKGFEKYSFLDYTKSYNADEQVMFDGDINAEGHADVPVKLDLGSTSPGKLNAFFNIRVFEPSGDFSVDRFSTTYSPFKRYVGVKLPENTRHRTFSTDTVNYFEVVTINENGSLTDVNNLEVQIFKTEWRWWWDASSRNYGNYMGSNYERMTYTTKVSTVNGRAMVPFEIKYPDWGRYMIRVIDKESNHSATQDMYMDWPNWRARAEPSIPDGANVLTFDTDTSDYEIGQTAKVILPSSGKGRALVTVENGSKILSAEWVETAEKELVYSIEITPEMAPNAFIHVMLIQEHAHQNSLPMRMYGVVPINVNNPASLVHPIIEMAEELKPESTTEIKISERDGRATTYTLAVVDEGLLDLTRFRTPDPHPVFYAKEALGVKTWDFYDNVIGAYSGELARVISIGGDEGVNGKGKDKVNRFKAMVRYIGPFTLDANDENTHEIAIPNYIGSVRVMVVAGQDGAYGNAEKAVPVKKPLMVLATLPRVLGPSEKVRLPVTVFAMDKKIKNVKIEVVANKMFQPGYEKSKTIHFDTPDDQVINFELEVIDGIGKATVQVIVSGHGERSTYEIELAVRNANSPVSRFKEMVVDAHTSWSDSIILFGVQGTNEATLELSRMAPIDFGRRLKQLIDYPHGCAEQTTSRAFPQLFLKNVMEEDKLIFERAALNVNIAIDKLRSFQHSDGGFRFWPSHTYSNDWVSSYIGHFMLEAEKKGFVVNASVKKNWLNYQKDAARSFTHDSKSDYYHLDFAQAYRLYTLALANEPDIGSMNRLKVNNNLLDVGIWRLAAAYYLAGQTGIADELVAGLSTHTTGQTTLNQYDYYSYGSKVRDEAMILEAMLIMGKRNEGISLMKSISTQLTSTRWMSTQTTAYALMTMVKFGGEKGVSNEMIYSYVINGKQKEDLTTLMPLKQIKVKEVRKKTGSFKLENKGNGLIYARMITTGTPKYGEEKVTENNVSLSVEYSDLKGKPIDVSRLEQGTDFMATVTILNPNSRVDLRDMALTQIFPSGWEIHNSRMNEGPNLHQQDVPDYEDIRDDRVLTYFDLNAYSSYPNCTCEKTYTVVLNAAYLGEFYLPGVKAEAMYDGQVLAITKGQWVKVVKPGDTE